MRVSPASIDEAAAKPALTGVVTVDVADERVFAASHGFAPRGPRLPNDPDTRLAVASGSTGFTALTVMRLVETGALALATRAGSRMRAATRRAPAPNLGVSTVPSVVRDDGGRGRGWVGTAALRRLTP